MDVALVNKSTVVPNRDIVSVCSSLNLQVKQDFFSFWNIKVNVIPINKGGIPPHDAWVINVLDDSDVSGALGYHTYGNKPRAKVFARTSIDSIGNWTSVASHELLEMLADPQGVLAALDYTTGKFYAYEVCDPVESWSYNIMDTDYPVSNFVLPSWFVKGGKGPYDFMQVTSEPFQVSEHDGDNFAQTLDVTCAPGWEIITARQREPDPNFDKHFYPANESEFRS